jgi:hypothetical protein
VARWLQRRDGPAACSRCGKMSRHRGERLGYTGRRDSSYMKVITRITGRNLTGYSVLATATLCREADYVRQDRPGSLGEPRHVCRRHPLACDDHLCVRHTHGMGGVNPAGWGAIDFENALECGQLEDRSLEYHRAAAARARRLLAEATTSWVKQQLADTIVRHEQMATQGELASVPDAGEAVPESETPRRG